MRTGIVIRTVVAPTPMWPRYLVGLQSNMSGAAGRDVRGSECVDIAGGQVGVIGEADELRRDGEIRCGLDSFEPSGVA